MKRLVLLIGVLLVLVGSVWAQDDERFVGTVPALEFAAGLDWINVEQPLTMAGLQGKIVIFDFWTYGCINCIHMIPVFEQLEAKYPDEVVIIGVHSAKFANEGQTDNIRQIVRRYGLTHPVINDKDFIVWREYGINAWPTLVIVDPRGNIVTGDSGEIPFDILDTYVGGMIAYYDALGNNEIDRTPLALALEGAGDPGTPLLFPGEVLADETGNRLFIADSNHHRIIIADLTTYEVLDIIGGQRSQANGTFEEAGFNQPQGLALAGDLLYIADTNNHQIRVANLTERTVTTIAGNGLMSPTLAVYGQEADNLTERPLRSPWDLAFGDDTNTLYIAMAGMHQVHVMDVARGVQKAIVGTGAEGQVNGALEQSELAQPSGLFFANGNLYIADSESSTVRAANFVQNQVQVVSGVTENSLFDFGDVDGLPGVSRLQHALGVAGTDDGSIVYIADTYNSRIKAVDTTTNETTTIFGLGGEGGYADGDAAVAQFDEPSGMSYANGKLYVADTNNQAIRVIDLASNTVTTVVFPNVEALITNTTVTVIGGNQANGNTITAEAVTLPVGENTLTLSLTLPDGYKINPLTDSVVEITSTDAAVSASQATIKIADKTVEIPFTLAVGSTDVTLDVSLFYCESETESVCLIDMTTFTIPITVSADAATSEWVIAHTVVLPKEYQ